jgi:hypothetical protein
MKNLKEALETGLAVGKEVQKALADNGKIDGVDEYLKIGLKATGLVKVVKNAPQIKQEFENLTEEEANGLRTWFEAEFDLQNDKVENIVENVFSVLIGLGGLVSDLK